MQVNNIKIIALFFIICIIAVSIISYVYLNPQEKEFEIIIDKNELEIILPSSEPYPRIISDENYTKFINTTPQQVSTKEEFLGEFYPNTAFGAPEENEIPKNFEKTEFIRTHPGNSPITVPNEQGKKKRGAVIELKPENFNSEPKRIQSP